MIPHSTPIREALVIVCVAIGLALVYNAFSPKSISLVRAEIVKNETDDAALFDDANMSDPMHAGGSVVRTITLAQFKRLVDEGRGVLIDARAPEDFQKGFVRGARNVFGLEADQHFQELAPIPRDTLMVLYCNNPECHLGPMLAEFLKAIGFQRIVIYDDGWDGWVAAGLPVEPYTPN
jgi:rhodanese-related sulfurtransferase